MVTGYDIIFFWVARMIFSGCEQMHKIPFHTVLIHGLVRDDKGRKMSKSLGNGIDPLEMAEKYGADALRFNLITGNSPGNDTRFYTEKCEAMRNFANKIWNASRFVMMNLTIDKCELPAADALAPEDKWVLSKLNTLVKEVTENLDAYEIGVASAKVYDFLWDTYCDWYIELTKTRLQGEDEDAKLVAQNVLCYVLTELLKLLHPFMPFITEEIWQALAPRAEGESICVAPMPQPAEEKPGVLARFELAHEVITTVRSIRNQKNLAQKEPLVLEVIRDENYPEEYAPLMRKMANLSAIDFITEKDSAAAAFLVKTTQYFVPMAGKIDTEAEIKKLSDDLAYYEGFLASVMKKLSNERFVQSAPEKVVANERAKQADAEAKIAALKEQIAALR